MFRIFGLIFLIFATSTKCSKPHEQFTDEEIYSIFKTTPDKMPEYDIGTVKHNLHKRSTENFRLNVHFFGDTIDLEYKLKNKALAHKNTPVWRAYTNSDGSVVYKKMLDGIVGMVAESFENFTDFGSIILREGNRQTLTLNGFLNKNMQIVPLPERLRRSSRSNFDGPKEREGLMETDDHVIIRTKSSSNNPDILEKKIQEISQIYNETNSSRSERLSSDVMRPSILVSTDYHDTKTTGNAADFYNDILYQLAFWNGVNMRLRNLENPKIHLRMAGIIIGQDRLASWWIKYHMSNNEFDGNLALNSMQNWPNITNHEMDYNIFVTMTDSQMYEIDKNGRKNVMSGMAINRICTRKNGRLTPSYAIVSDKHAFDGLVAATYVLGHIFGASPDDAEDGECSKSLGYIMSRDLKSTDNRVKWSSCSQASISKYLSHHSNKCDKATLYHHGDQIRPILPGLILNSEQQCQLRGYPMTYPNQAPSLCQSLKCSYSVGWALVHNGINVGPPADGTICRRLGDHCRGESCYGACIDGRCWEIPEQTIKWGP